MKWLLLFLVLTLVGCTEIDFQESDDMSQGNPQYAKSGGWSGGGPLQNDGASNAGMAANFIAGRQHNETPSKNYTVQFALTVPQGSFINPVAEISWSVEGVTVRRLVSVTNGCSVTGVGQGVKVVVKDQTPQNIAGITYGVAYQVDITVAPGSRSSVNQPPTYTPIGGTVITFAPLVETVVLAPFSVPPGGLAVVAVPQNAGVISAYVTAVSDDFSPLGQFKAVVDQVDQISTGRRIYDAFPQSFVPIVPEITALNLFNKLGGGGANILYSISFGIDG